MRNLILRIFVALLTFTIGVLVAQPFLWEITPPPAQEVEFLPKDSVGKIIEDYNKRCYEPIPPALYIDDKGNFRCTGELGDRKIKKPSCS
ncbi:MAG: hypothetical protein H0U54_12590 [Acidobacteria bacterium]|nr:hypothetical protein [Acidobacteriota bacterium]